LGNVYLAESNVKLNNKTKVQLSNFCQSSVSFGTFNYQKDDRRCVKKLFGLGDEGM